jgi:Phospholipid methyltransferase
LFLALLAAPFLQHLDAPLLVRLLGLVLLAGGIVVAVAGYRALGSSHSPWTTPIDDGRLVKTGIYARIRHPIYTGWCLGALGGELLAGSILGVGVGVGWRWWSSMTAGHARRSGSWPTGIPTTPPISVAPSASSPGCTDWMGPARSFGRDLVQDQAKLPDRAGGSTSDTSSLSASVDLPWAHPEAAGRPAARGRSAAQDPRAASRPRPSHPCRRAGPVR